MRYCEHCEINHTNPACPRCGRTSTTAHAQPEVPRTSTFVSEVDPSVENVDELVEQASRPSLASLIKAGLERGLIKPIQDYAHQRKS
jgi:hypothetical protein